MPNLRLLQVANVNFSGSFKHLFKKTRWISWQAFSLEHLPFSLQTENLAALEMQNSKLKSIWEGNTVFKQRLVSNLFSWMSGLWLGDQIQFPRHLKILNLSHSKCLTSTPDFRNVPSLVALILTGCTSLVEIDPSVGCLGSLLVLNMEGCEKITNIPSEICRLRSLGYLNLNGCLNLKHLPDKIGDIEFLRELYADETAIAKLPTSLGKHRNLRSLSLRGCTNISANGNMTSFGLSSLREDLTSFGSLSFLREDFTSIRLRSLIGERSNVLRRLILRDCNMSNKDIPANIGWLSELRELDLAGNTLTKLPDDFRRLINIELLWLDDWRILQSIPELPPNLKALLAKNIPNERYTPSVPP